MTPVEKTQLVKTLAHELGFNLVGVIRAEPPRRTGYYRDWLAAGYGGTMAYLGRNVRVRADPRLLLPGARSLICVALNYKRADGYGGPRGGSAVSSPPSALSQPTGRVAQYARGRDYHVVLRRMLGALAAALRERLREPFDAGVFVDTGPVLEREYAAAAGLGWIGKNTCLLNGQLGSYLFLGEVVTTLELVPDEPVLDRCASCTRCLAACPTDAFIGAHQLDASRCISYLTIEHRGPIPEQFHAAIGDRVYGCDECQQVCPYNAKAPLATHPEITADVTPATVDLLALLQLRTGDYRRLTKDSAAARARRNMWRRNAAVALGNVGQGSDAARETLEAARTDADEAVRHAATTSLKRLRPM